MNKEMNLVNVNNTWTLASLPKGCKPTTSKWIYKLKKGITKDSQPRYKARLATKSFTQREGIDYFEMFSLIVKQTSIRFLLSLVAQNNLELDQLDVKTTFVHGYLDETICIEQLKGFEV